MMMGGAQAVLNKGEVPTARQGGVWSAYFCLCLCNYFGRVGLYDVTVDLLELCCLSEINQDVDEILV